MLSIIPTPQYINDKHKSVCFKSAKISCAAEFVPSFDIPKGNDLKISICVNPDDIRFDGKGKADAYIIDINEEGAFLCGYDNGGAYYACVTFAKLIKNDGKAYTLPQCFILDYPHYKIRGYFMECRYGSDFMTLEDWKKAIDYLSEMKINTLTIGLYGCWPRQYDGMLAEYQYIPFKKYPQLKTPRHIKYYSPKQQKLIVKENVLPVMYEDDYFGEMAAYGKTKNIEVIPLFNSLGHNTLIPRLMPEISAVNEKGEKRGLGFCTNNPQTYEVMFDIYDEIIDRYLKPNGIKSFEAGLDEVWNMIGIDETDWQREVSPFCQCEKCRNTEYGELMIQYIIKIAKHMKEKGIENLYIYHDMLFKYNLLNQATADRFREEGIYDMIVIDWWSYHDTKEDLFKGRTAEIDNHFRSVGKPITGYFHWTIPTQTCKNIDLISEITEKHGFEGMLSYSAFEYCYDYTYQYYAQSCWNPDGLSSIDDIYANLRFPNDADVKKAMENVNSFMYDGYGQNCTLARKGLEFYHYSYLAKDTEYPQSYPAKVYASIKNDKEKYISYLEKTLENSRTAYNYFGSSDAEFAPVWKLNAGIYMAICDEFLTVYNTSNKFNEGSISKETVIKELERLVAQRDEVMELCEDVRIPANQYTMMRNMTIARQYVLDLKSYLENKDVTEIIPWEFDRYLSDASWFLR